MEIKLFARFTNIYKVIRNFFSVDFIFMKIFPSADIEIPVYLPGVRADYFAVQPVSEFARKFCFSAGRWAEYNNAIIFFIYHRKIPALNYLRFLNDKIVFGQRFHFRVLVMSAQKFVY